MIRHLLRNEILLVALIFLLGAGFRLYHIDYPLGLHGNEAQTGLDALRILRGAPLTFWAPELAQPNLIVYLVVVVFHFFPADLTSLRLSYSVFWILSMPFFYGIVRMLFDKQVALISFFFFVIDRTLLHFSHIAYSPYIPPFLLSTFFFLYALKYKKHWAFAVSGLLTGLAVYFYLGLFILPVLFFIYLAYHFRTRKAFIQNRLSIVLFVVCFLLSIVPFIVIAHIHHISPFIRTDAIGIFSKEATLHLNNDTSIQNLTQQVIKTLLMFHVQGDQGIEENVNRLPLLDPVAGIFFLIGLIFCCVNVRKPSVVFLLLWLIIFLLNTIFAVGAPNFRRIQPAIAATWVIVTLGITTSYTLFTSQFPRYKPAAIVVLCVSFLSITFANPYVYFTKQATDPNTEAAFGYHIVKTAHFLSAVTNEHPTVFVYFYPKDFDMHHETVRFLAPEVSGENRKDYRQLENNHPERPILYVLPAKHIDAIKHVQSVYPGGKNYLVSGINDEVLLYAYLVIP